MLRRHRLPQIWLFTDERQNETLLAAIARLPRCSAVVFRHYSHPNRAALAAKVRDACRRRGHLFIVAGNARVACAWRADGHHGRSIGAYTSPAHNLRELTAARRRGARLAFLSPVFATRSHPDARVLGPLRFGLLARSAGLPVAALGGMSAARFRMLRPLGAVAWGAIDALSRQPAAPSRVLQPLRAAAVRKAQT